MDPVDQALLTAAIRRFAPLCVLLAGACAHTPRATSAATVPACEPPDRSGAEVREDPYGRPDTGALSACDIAAVMRSHKGDLLRCDPGMSTTVTVELTLDAAGVPHVTYITPDTDRGLISCLETVIATFRFRANGGKTPPISYPVRYVAPHVGD
jgi:hypothetical protein